MATLTGGIHGKASQVVGNVSYYTDKGQNIARQTPSQYNDRASDAQLAVRTRMQNAITFGNPLNSYVIGRFWSKFNKGTTPWSQWLKVNTAYFTKTVPPLNSDFLYCPYDFEENNIRTLGFRKIDQRYALQWFLFRTFPGGSSSDRLTFTIWVFNKEEPGEIRHVQTFIRVTQRWQGSYIFYLDYVGQDNDRAGIYYSFESLDGKTNGKQQSKERNVEPLPEYTYNK